MSPFPLAQRVEQLRPMTYAVGLGHLIDFDALQIAGGYSLRTYDVNLDTKGAVRERGGIEYIAENGACGMQIATCEEGDWDANSTADAVRFRQWDYGGPGLGSRKLTAAVAGTITSKRPLAHVNLSTDEDEYICWWTYVEDPAKLTDIALILSSGEQEAMAPDDVVVMAPLGFSGLSGAGSFTYRVPAASLTAGWNFFAKKKSAFTVAGSPAWTDLTSVSVEMVATAATAVNFDNIWLGPAHLYGLYNFRRSAAGGGGNWYLAAGRGQIDVFVPEQFRWKPLITGLVRDEVVNFFTLNDFCYAVKKSDTVRLIVDNEHAYIAGIDPPAAPPIATVAAGGNISAGAHEAAVVFWSAVTGKESAPVFVEVTVAANNSKIEYTNLPVSADTKVSFLRIYRFAPGRPGYQRVSAALDGEVPNGTTTYSDGTASTSLGALLEGSPNYDINLPPGRARVAAVVGNHVLYDDPEAPGRIRVSRENSAEQVPLDGSVALDQGDNDDITSIFNADGAALVFKHNSFYVGPKVKGGLQPFDFVRKSEKIGSLSHRGVIGSDEGLIRWRHTTGYYAMNYGWVPRKIARGWDKPSSIPTAEPSLRTFESGRGELVTSAYRTDRDQIYWTETVKGMRFPGVQPVLHEDLSSEELQSGWSFHRAPVSILAQAVDSSFDELILGGGAAGIVFRLDTSRRHDLLVQGKQAIVTDYMTPPLDRQEKAAGVGPRTLKTYKYLDVLMRPEGNWPLQYDVFYDWRPAGGSSGSITPSARIGDRLGTTFRTGRSRLGGRGADYQRARLKPGRHSSIMIHLVNANLDQAPHFSELTVWLIPRRSGASRY